MTGKKLTLGTLGAIMALALTNWAGPTSAQMDHGDHGMETSEDVAPSTRAYMAASDVMHGDMAIEYTGDADIDFAKGMIPHHEGAIAMAQIVLEHGEDSEIRALAEEIIAAQESEIAMLRAWLAARGH